MCGYFQVIVKGRAHKAQTINAPHTDQKIDVRTGLSIKLQEGWRIVSVIGTATLMSWLLLTPTQ